MSEFAACYLTLTAVMAAMQFVENLVNGDAGKHYAPVWWIAITWPFWLLYVPLTAMIRKAKEG